MNLSDLAAQAEGKILSGVVANVGHVVINNPERHNAISLEMYKAAAERVNVMVEDPEARLLVIQGAGGKAFASGADISKFENDFIKFIHFGGGVLTKSELANGNILATLIGSSLFS